MKYICSLSRNSLQAPSMRWIMLLCLLVPATFLMAVDRAVLTILAPVIQSSWHLKLSQLGLLFSAFFWAYAAAQIPAGLFVERFGTRFSLCTAIVFWSAMTLATPFATNFLVLLVVRAALGVGQAPDWPATIVSISRQFDSRQRPAANSIVLCSLYLGPVIGAPLTIGLLSLIGLTGIFVAFGVVGFAFAVIWWLFYREGSALIATETQCRPPVAPVRRFSLRLLGRGWVLIPAYICTGFVLAFYVTWFPTYLIKARGMSMQTMGLYSAVTSASLCIAVLVAGRFILFLTKKMPTLRLARAPVGAASLLVAGLATVLLPTFASDAALLISACVALIALGFSQVVTWSCVQDLGGDNTGALTGAVSLGGNFAAGVTPLLSAMLVEYSGSWSSSFVALGLFGLLGALIWLFINPDISVSEIPCRDSIR